jgi:hypothetical protein
LKRETHSFSLNAAMTGVEGLSVSAGIQNEWGWQQGFGKVFLDEGDPANPLSLVSDPVAVDSDLDKEKFAENFSLRFTEIPWTVLYAEARLENESIRQMEDQLGSDHHDFSRDTDADNTRQNYRIGFNTSPWGTISFTAQYKKEISDSDYNHLRDVSPEGGAGYPAFIRARKIDTDELMAKIVVRPARWLKTTLSYRLLATDYFTSTDPVLNGTNAPISPGGRNFAGNNDAHVFSLNATLTPISRLYFGGTLSYTKSRTATTDSYSPFVVPYRGDIYSVLANANFALNKTTELQALYSFSQANYGQNNFANGVPMGIDYTRHVVGFGIAKRWTEYLKTNLRYNFYRYAEPSSGNENNFVAHGIFATLTLKWP